MGLSTFGFPPETTLWLKTQLSLNVFIEAGTYKGGSTKQAAGMFERVVTIEKSHKLYMDAEQLFASATNVSCYQGCTRDHITSHINQSDKPLFWLDAHWSGGETAGQEDECPILDELSLIFSKNINSFAILIDDARLFTAPPPRPHNSKQWPRIDEIAKKIPNRFALYVFNDVIYIVPEHVAESFSEFLQDMALATSQRLPQKNTLGLAAITRMLTPTHRNKPTRE